MTAEFCGNPFNHEGHEFTRPGDETVRVCEGVGRVEVKEEIVEKYDPNTQAADGTAYSKITIFVEHQDGTSEVLTAEKASAQMLEVEHEKYVAMDVVAKNFDPEIRRAIFSFTPKKDIETGVAFTIQRLDANGNARE